MLKITMCLLAGLVVAVPASADTWIDLNVASHHFSKRKFNQNNIGVGLEYSTGDMTAMAGRYRNSVGAQSNYVMGAYTPLKLGIASIGVAAGVVNGYPAANNGKYIPVAAALMKIEYERVGMNVLVMPPAYKSPLAIGLQVKFKF